MSGYECYIPSEIYDPSTSYPVSTDTPVDFVPSDGMTVKPDSGSSSMTDGGGSTVSKPGIWVEAPPPPPTFVCNASGIDRPAVCTASTGKDGKSCTAGSNTRMPGCNTVCADGKPVACLDGSKPVEGSMLNLGINFWAQTPTGRIPDSALPAMVSTITNSFLGNPSLTALASAYLEVQDVWVVANITLPASFNTTRVRDADFGPALYASLSKDLSGSLGDQVQPNMVTDCELLYEDFYSGSSGIVASSETVGKGSDGSSGSSGGNTGIVPPRVMSPAASDPAAAGRRRRLRQTVASPTGPVVISLQLSGFGTDAAGAAAANAAAAKLAAVGRAGSYVATAMGVVPTVSGTTVQAFMTISATVANSAADVTATTAIYEAAATRAVQAAGAAVASIETWQDWGMMDGTVSDDSTVGTTVRPGFAGGGAGGNANARVPVSTTSQQPTTGATEELTANKGASAAVTVAGGTTSAAPPAVVTTSAPPPAVNANAASGAAAAGARSAFARAAMLLAAAALTVEAMVAGAGWGQV